MIDKKIPVKSGLWAEEELLEIQTEYLRKDPLALLTEDEIEHLCKILELKYKLINHIIGIDEYYKKESEINSEYLKEEN